MSGCTNPELGALLHAFEIGALSKQDAERFEDHLLECDFCFNEAKEFGPSADLMRRSTKFRDIAVSPKDNAERPAQLLRRFWRYLWPDAPLAFRPGLSYLLVLLVLVPAYYGLRHSSDADIRPVQTMTLLSDRSTDEAAFRISHKGDGVISFYFDGAILDSAYEIIVEDESGTEIFRHESFGHFDMYGRGELLFPHVRMKPKRYRLLITGPRQEFPPGTQEYWFRIVD